MRSLFSAKTTLVGGVFTGIGASACCLGPFLLLSMGIGGAWIGHLTALEPYRPVFIALTLLFLGMTFRKLYLVPQTCATGGACIADRSRKTQRILFWTLLPVVLLIIASPWILPLLYR